MASSRSLSRTARLATDPDALGTFLRTGSHPDDVLSESDEPMTPGIREPDEPDTPGIREPDTPGIREPDEPMAPGIREPD
ncbi:MAG: hypothetical protein HKN41_09560, partial [Ilumatobacter sp.]|nr:hypothetical protein [Ilumatobacter sp.]